MASGSALEFCIFVLFCVSMRCGYVEMLPSTFLQDEQQQAEQQAETISERFFDEVRQLLEQKISSEAAAAAELDVTTTESPVNINSDERYIETTISPTSDQRVRDNLPTIMPPRPTQVNYCESNDFACFNTNFPTHFVITVYHRWLIGQNLIYA